MWTLASLTALAISGASATVAGSQNVPRAASDARGPYIASTAPYENIFAGISNSEASDIEDFLERQNSSSLRDVQYWDYRPWLLPPNKTEATTYLAGNGPKPPRYARVMGYGDCFEREYMVGPLPIGNSTKATPLAYVNNGNPTVVYEGCEEENEDLMRRVAKRAVNRRSQTPAEARKMKTKRRRSIQRRDPTNPYDEEMEWNGDELPHDDKSPPVTILPDGARYEFDPDQNYVSWMGFSFYVATGPAGISLHDVHFRGERVVYELAMQEALAHYAGPDESQTYASYLDVTIDFMNFNLIPGYDCPSYATYTDAFCLFEFPKDYPMSRHYDWSSFHATKNIAFMVRSISTIGNYDYQTTYEFYYDGSIQVLVRASGYIQGSSNVNATNAWDYGFHIRKDLSGSMHDHVLNFKADLDILGTNNTLFKSEFVPHSQVYPWSGGEVVNTMKVERSFVTNEDQGKINWAPNAAAAYSVVNKDKPNCNGEFPGFRIYPSTGSTTHLTVQNSTVFGNLVNWATHHMYALRRKDSEPVSAHPRSSGWSDQAIAVDFNDFFDGESIEQEDIVLYFNLGMHHMPDTYDLPVTVFQGAQSGITLRPQNYKRSDSAISTRQQIHITGDEDGVANVETYGVEPLAGSYDLEDANPPWYPAPY
ncbi:copper amine oxidase [Stachybotrys elegans]|uniref:Amine oxidase n=1 Tax=Stachybotrys elegans TaxID=80388 RepID=A0A8K0SJN3_9HYPO|nr:copper amine oxidase [Stachybotrys elegans]